jgi:hypothetical protein
MKTAHRQRSIGRGLDGPLPALEAASRRFASGTVLIGRELQEVEKQGTAARRTGGGDSDGA